MEEKVPYDQRPTEDNLSSEETKPKKLKSERNKVLYNEEREVVRNESSTKIKEVYRVDEGEGPSGIKRFANEFGEAASRLPPTVKKVEFVQNTVVHGDVKNENIMNKQEVGDGGLIQHTTVMAPENKPRVRIPDEELEDMAGHSIDKIHEQIIVTEDIEMELDGLEKPDKVIPPEMSETTKYMIVRNSAMDKIYYPINKEFIKPKGNYKPIRYDKIVRLRKGFLLNGPAGSGKSTMLIKFVKDIIKKEKKNAKKQRNRKNRKLVLHVELKLLRYEEDITPHEALLNTASRRAIEPEECNILIKWMDRNPKRVVVVMDGYDQIPINITKEDKLPEYGYRNSSMNQYLYGLLAGKVLPGAMVVLSTREYALKNIPYDCIPQRVIKLDGLSDENIDKLVVQLSNKNVLEAIKKSDRVVYFLCRSPLFLTLVTWVHSYMKENPLETKSGILLCVVFHFLQLDSHIRGNTVSSLYKLAELALYGIELSKIVFTRDEISRFHLQQEDLKDLVISIPKSSKYRSEKQRLMAGNYQQYFVHQMLQEILASLKIILMDPNQFNNYCGKLTGGNFEEVAQLTYGLIFRNENQDMLSELADDVNEKKQNDGNSTTKDDVHDKGKFEKLKDLSEHRTIALKHLKARLKDGEVGDLQTLRLLYESGDAAIIQNNVKEIRLLKSLNEFDCFCLGKVLEKSKEFSKLWLCDTDDDLIGILIQSCEKIPKIDLLTIGGVYPTTIGKYYGKLSNHANWLVLDCTFTKQEFDSFVDEIEEKFTEVTLDETDVKLEHLDGLIRLMSHIDGTLYLTDVGGGTNITSEVKEKIPRQYQGCTVKYYSERRRTVQPVPQIEAEQPIATEGNIPRLNQGESEYENETD